MVNLEEKKISKEIELLDAELDLRQRQKLYTNLKIALGAIVVVLLLLLIIQPETILNRSASGKTIDRERARLLIDVLKVDDPEMRKVNLEILNETYLQGEDDWWTSIQQRLLTEADHELRLSLHRQINTLSAKNEETRSRLQDGNLSALKIEIAKGNLALYDLEIKRLKLELGELE